MINIRQVVKQTAKFNAVSIASALVQIPTQIFIGIFLIPEEYGVISFVGLWSLYGGLANPGMFAAANREIPYLIGQNNHGKALKVQNIAISSDLIYSILPFLVIFCSSLFYSSKIVKIGLILTATYYIANRFPTYWTSINFVRQKFSIVAVGKFIGVLIPPIFIICSISFIGVYSLLIAPIICAFSTGMYFWYKGPINYHFEWDWVEIKRMIKIGFVFSLIGIIFYGYKMADSTIIASFLPFRDLGLFSFAMTLVLFGVNFLQDFGRVLEPILYEDSGRTNKQTDSFGNTNVIIVYMAVIISMIIPVSQIGYGLIIKLYLPKYIESIPIFLILSNMLYLASLPTIPNIILSSVVVNKQKYVTIIYAGGLIINIFMGLLMIKLGYGIKAISFVTVGSQLLITAIIFGMARIYILTKKENIIKYIFYIIFPFMISVTFSLLNNYFIHYDISIWQWVFYSILLQTIVWTTLIYIFYREYFPKSLITHNL